MLSLISVACIVTFLILLKLNKRWIAVAFLIYPFVYPFLKPREINELYKLTYIYLICIVVTIILILLFSSEKIRVQHKLYLVVAAFVLWFSVSQGLTYTNIRYDDSAESVKYATVTEMEDVFQGRGISLIDYKEVICKLDKSDEVIAFEIEASKTENIQKGDKVRIAYKDGLFNWKYCYLVI